MILWNDKYFYCPKYKIIALLRNGSQKSLTPNRNGHLSTKPFPKLSYAYHFTHLTVFYHQFLRQWLNVPHGEARNPNPFCFLAWRIFLGSPSVLQRTFPGFNSFLHSPAPLLLLPSETRTLNAAWDTPSLFAGTDAAWAQWPPKRIIFALLPAERNCLLGFLRSAKIIPTVLGKSPGCAFFKLKMENWGQYSCYNFLNSNSLKIKNIYAYVYIFRARTRKQLGIRLRGWLQTEQLCWS